MSYSLPMAEEEYFDKVEHQGKVIKTGDTVIVSQAGKEKAVEVSSIIRKQGHYWVGYNNNAPYCPWPLVRLKQTTD